MIKSIPLRIAALDDDDVAEDVRVAADESDRAADDARAAATALRIAADEAMFGLSEVNFGHFPGGPVSKQISAIMRPREAIYYILTGDQFNGKRAAEIGSFFWIDMEESNYVDATLDARAQALITTARSAPSVCACTAFENSICSRRGRSRLCSSFMMYATPPLPDCELTRMTAS